MTTTKKATHITNWELILACMSYRGRCRGLVSPGLDRLARYACDGFGDLRSMDQAVARDCFFDWSHIRDSSEAARARCAQVLTDGLVAAGKLAAVFHTIRDQGALEPAP